VLNGRCFRRGALFCPPFLIPLSNFHVNSLIQKRGHSPAKRFCLDNSGCHPCSFAAFSPPPPLFFRSFRTGVCHWAPCEEVIFIGLQASFCPFPFFFDPVLRVSIFLFYALERHRPVFHTVGHSKRFWIIFLFPRGRPPSGASGFFFLRGVPPAPRFPPALRDPCLLLGRALRFAFLVGGPFFLFLLLHRSAARFLRPYLQTAMF